MECILPEIPPLPEFERNWFQLYSPTQRAIERLHLNHSFFQLKSSTSTEAEVCVLSQLGQTLFLIITQEDLSCHEFHLFTSFITQFQPQGNQENLFGDYELVYGALNNSLKSMDLKYETETKTLSFVQRDFIEPKSKTQYAQFKDKIVLDCAAVNNDSTYVLALLYKDALLVIMNTNVGQNLHFVSLGNSLLNRPPKLVIQDFDFSFYACTASSSSICTYSVSQLVKNQIHQSNFPQFIFSPQQLKELNLRDAGDHVILSDHHGEVIYDLKKKKRIFTNIPRSSKEAEVLQFFFVQIDGAPAVVLYVKYLKKEVDFRLDFYLADQKKVSHELEFARVQICQISAKKVTDAEHSKLQARVIALETRRIDLKNKDQRFLQIITFEIDL